MWNQRRLDPNNGSAGDRVDDPVVATSSHEVGICKCPTLAAKPPSRDAHADI